MSARVGESHAKRQPTIRNLKVCRCDMMISGGYRLRWFLESVRRLFSHRLLARKAKKAPSGKRIGSRETSGEERGGKEGVRGVVVLESSRVVCARVRVSRVVSGPESAERVCGWFCSPAGERR